MRHRSAYVALAAAFAVAAVAAPVARARASVDPSLFAGLHWRSIGPYRGGRAVAVAGVAGDPRTFYFGSVGGGVWKTENAGRTWRPVMDGQPVASIGALAVAPSDPATIYAGSGEADMRNDIIHGNGMYVSHDAGATWTHAGLDDSYQIGRILVAPRDPKTLLVAALGHAFGPNDMRGVYRSTDGGASWTRALFVDRDTGAVDLAADPSGKHVFASLWQTRRPPWTVYPPSSGPGSGLYESSDGGVAWKQVKGGGFPESVGKVGIAVAPSDPKRVYAVLFAAKGGLYRSDDAGATWKLADADPRLWTRCWYFCHVAVDPKNADVVYVSDTSFYRSTDGGATFEAIKGSPDGDDFHMLWIDPTAPERMILGSDQGASISIDGARTWSSWFNQPTGQFYHVATDDAFPYSLYGAQQDSGAATILSRSDYAGIQERNWRPMAAGGESGAVALDPKQPGIVYGGFVDREDLHSNQVRSLSPTAGMPGSWRAQWTMPLTFGPDGALYATRQVVFASSDRGLQWRRISGDLSRKHAGVPATLDAPTAADADGPEPRGVVYALAPSPLRSAQLWAGTDDGLVYVTRDGGATWKDVTPRAVTPWSSVDAIEPSHYDAAVAYVPVDRHRLDDDKPYIYVTRDGGATWRESSAGIPDGSFVYAVREDPVRRNLLYAATETGVFASFDGAASWQPLRLNMPVVSVHDVTVHGDDLAIATHGRAFWILDDVAPLRQLAAGAGGGTRLFAPQVALRTRDYNDQAEALPPEVPLGENPPNGAYIDYALAADAPGLVTLSIADRAGHVVRSWSSADKPDVQDAKDVDYPAYWIVKPAIPAATAGMHRFVWDFHTGSDGPLAPPGTYVVTLGASGATYRQTLELRRDPRVRATDADLAAQYQLAAEIDALMARAGAAIAGSRAAKSKPGANVAAIDAIVGTMPPTLMGMMMQNAPFALSPAETLRSDVRLLGALEGEVESADAAPSTGQRAAWASLRARVERLLAALAKLSS